MQQNTAGGIGNFMNAPVGIVNFQNDMNSITFSSILVLLVVLLRHFVHQRKDNLAKGQTL